MLAALATVALAATPAPLDGFDAWVDAQLATWKQPGAAVAIVKDAEVVLARGYGHRDLARKLPVTSKTLFSIGSVSKSFTALLVARLVEQGKLSWDEPVRARLPEFALMDPTANAQCSARDLVLHRSGLARHDFLNFMLRDVSRAEVVSRLRYLEPHQPFREAFEYNNLGFVAVGRLAEVAAGKRYEELVREQIFAPLGMKTASTVFKDFANAPDHALGYQRAADGPRLTKDFSFSLTQTDANPSGSLVASADDLARYLVFQLGDGAPLLGPASFDELHRPQMAVPDAPQFPELSAASYALGWYVASYRGHRLVYHTGSTRGFTAFVAMLPDEHVGVAALGDLDDERLPNAIAYTVLDRYLGAEAAPWSERFLSQTTPAPPSTATLKREGTHPSHALDEYAGVYAHPAYGTLTVTSSPSTSAAPAAPGDLRSGRALRVRVGPEEAPLEHFHYETFIAVDEPTGRIDQLRFEFVTDARGDVAQVRAAFEPTTRPIEFQRVPDARLTDPKFLATLTGHYTGSSAFDVALRGNALHVLSASGEDHLLLPRRGTSFDIADLPAQSIRFDAGALVWFGARSTVTAYRTK